MIPDLDLSGKTVILGIGSDQGDDQVGPYIIQNLTPTPNPTPINCGTTPENFLGKIEAASSDSILIVDAADFGGQPGEARVLDPRQIQLSISTHNPTNLLLAFLKNSAPVTVLGIQPKSKTEFTEPIKTTAEEIIKLLSQPIYSQNPKYIL